MPVGRTVGASYRKAAASKASAKRRAGNASESSARVRDDLTVASRFETPTASVTGVALLLGSQLGLFALMCESHPARDAMASLLWSCVLVFQHGWVLAPGADPGTARVLTYACSVLVVLLPHLPVCKAGLGRATGAAQGAASMLTIMRAFQALHHIEAHDPAWERANGQWRRFYQGCGLSWHDLDKGRTHALPAGSGHAREMLFRMIAYIVLLALPAAAISMLPAPQAIVSTLMMVRCLLMAGALVAAFNVFDAAYLCLMSAVNGIAVESIMKGGFWSSKTVSEIWLGWNLPVQRLLSHGIYLPLRRRGVPKVLAKFLVFIVSGIGHVYPCIVCGLSRTQIAFMMCFFVAQVVLIAVEGALQIRSGIWAIGVEVALSPLFVMPVLMFTDPALEPLQGQLRFTP